MDLTDLRRTISLCKEGINSADQNLIKLTGRNYDKNENAPNNQRFLTKRRITVDHEIPNEIKKPRNDKDGPSLNSVVQMTRGRTRDDALTELKNKENPKEKERCKRLFGHLMGTLNSIKKDAERSSNDPQNITRLKIEKKVEEGNKLINESILKEQNELLRSKRERQNDLKILNQRYRAAEAFDRWRNEKEKMKGFIRTSKPPFIFYRPKIINEEAQLRIDQTSRQIDEMIESRKKKLETEIIKAVKYSELHLDGHVQRTDINDPDSKTSLQESGEFVSNHTDNNKKLRSRSPVDSLASEDYEDMIEEIEISMHDETAVVHEEEAPQQVIQEPMEIEQVPLNSESIPITECPTEEIQNEECAVKPAKEHVLSEQEVIVQKIKPAVTGQSETTPMDLSEPALDEKSEQMIIDMSKSSVINQLEAVETEQTEPIVAEQSESIILQSEQIVVEELGTKIMEEVDPKLKDEQQDQHITNAADVNTQD